MKLSLARLTLVAWLAWLATLGSMAWLSCRRILHPSVAYMAIPLAVQLISTATLLGGGIWFALRGPRRWNAVAWMLFGVLPILWMADYTAFPSVAFAAGRNHRPNLLTRCREGGGIFSSRSPICERTTRIDMRRSGLSCGPIRPSTTTPRWRRWTTIFAAIGESPRPAAAYKVYWVRGPVWGIDGRGGSGWALGSRPSTHDPGTDRLSHIDRHEVAHFVLDEFCPSGSQKYRELHEGWAELHSGPESESHWQECSYKQQQGKLPSLRQLTSHECYYNSLGPMYSLGSVVVEYILKRFGHEKFLELCCTCREATFPDDVQRITWP